VVDASSRLGWPQFRFQEGPRVNPHMERAAAFGGQLELIGIAVLDLIRADELDLVPLAA